MAVSNQTASFQQLFHSVPQIYVMEEFYLDSYYSLNFHIDNEYHELVYVLDGKFTLELRHNRRYDFSNGDIALMPFGIEHRDVFDPRSNLKIIFASFSWPGFEHHFEMSDNLRLRKMPLHDRMELQGIFEHLRYDCGGNLSSTRNERYDHAIANVRLMNVLLLVMRFLAFDSAPPVIRNKQHELVVEIRNYIDRHYMERLQLPDLANSLRVSPFHLSRVFSAECGFSIFDYLTEVRIQHAKKLLRDRRYTVAEIAEKVGYENGNYFAKVFRRHTGVSPSKFS